ncbi:MAG: hypothetical protein COX57_02800 [Alphaproteobacteria bacterium CG_4_10_14_0_2_um_filter_63_37]|nr:MAG: hypothetical protein AUJ55_03270 [Proteobacteria bacterium CG1_02_64_396]PJA25473.1 MAG: hypothetical protein COX57_02800 [Alphaproteobacteria bacterium CG_4_10_14_0_2_um_filter_63_37]
MDIEAISSRTRSQKTISTTEAQASFDLGNKQPYLNMKGGVGIPGSRTLEGVSKFKSLDFGNMNAELTGIVSGSQQARSMPSLKEKRKLAQTLNRQVIYEPNQTGVHSLHIGNDIAAVYNSRKKKKSAVYDYAALARGLDRRIGDGLDPKDQQRLAQRRRMVATGMQEIVRGDLKSGLGFFKASGVGQAGRNWAYKMTTVMLSEHARGLFASQGKSPKRRAYVHQSLEHIGNHSFREVFASPLTKRLAPFALSGGAKTFRK